MTVTMDDVLEHDAVGQAELLRAGHVSPVELVCASIERIEDLNPMLNAVIHDRFERVVEEARGVQPGSAPFAGVPMVVKNALGAIGGEPYHLGMRALADVGWTAGHDSVLVERFRRAGFVIVGHTNTPELALSVTTEPVAYGPTRNPWDPTRSTGGSSGGSAAAVATGMVAVGHGNDMGGSIRVPASWCGLFGLKPTYGRTSLAPDFNEYWGQNSHEHVLTRSVRDSAAVLDAVHGPEPGDMSPAPRPTQPFSSALERPPAPLRIALRTELPFVSRHADPTCVAAVEMAAHRLEALGHDVLPADGGPFDEPGHRDLLATITSGHAAAELDRIGGLVGREMTATDVEAWTWGLAHFGRSMGVADYVHALHGAQQLRRSLEHWRRDRCYDLVLTPATACVAPVIGDHGGASSFEEVMWLAQRGTAFTAPFNLTGWPAASIPTQHDGVPVGVQLAATYGREDLVLAVAAQLEEAFPFARLA